MPTGPAEVALPDPGRWLRNTTCLFVPRLVRRPRPEPKSKTANPTLTSSHAYDIIRILASPPFGPEQRADGKAMHSGTLVSCPRHRCTVTRKGAQNQNPVRGFHRFFSMHNGIPLRPLVDEILPVQKLLVPTV